MDAAVEAVLAEYEARIQREHELAAKLSEADFSRRRDEFLLPVGPATAQFMSALAHASRPKVLLEIGTSYGYSTLFLAEAARAVGGMLHTLELAPHKSVYARERIQRAGLANWTVFHMGDARELIARLDGPFDFVLLDLWKTLYIPCFDLVYPKLGKGVFLIADNMIEPAAVRADAEAYRKHVRGKPGISSVLLPIGSGIELSRYD